LGIGGLANITYLKFMFPVLVVMLGVYLFLLLKQSKRVGYGPFLVSLAGALTISIARQYSPLIRGVLNLGIALVLAGSIWNTFSMKRLKAPFSNPNNIKLASV
jgi:hypothetical protein